MGRAPRYFAFGREGISHRLFGVNMIEALEAVESSSAVLHAVIQYSNAVPDLRKNRRKRNCMKNQNCFNCLKRPEKTLVLSLGSLIGPKIDWTDWNYKND
jgi:hypothetical protein